jgi:hypothetical protein
MYGALPLPLGATPGRLKGASICTGANGITYGHHGDGHWHEAAKRSRGWWYPQGDNLGYTNPCNRRPSTGSSERTIGAPPKREKPPKKAEPKKRQREPTKLEVKTAKVERFFLQIKKELSVVELINLFDVKAIDEEEGDLSPHIITQNNQPLVIANEDKKHEIIFKVLNSGGQVTEQKVELHVKQRNEPTMQQAKLVMYEQTPTCEQVLARDDIIVHDADGNKLPLTCDQIQVDEAKQELIIRAVDRFDIEKKFIVDYKLHVAEEKQASTELLPTSNEGSEPKNNEGAGVLVGVVIGIGGYHLYLKRKEKKAHKLHN